MPVPNASYPTWFYVGGESEVWDWPETLPVMTEPAVVHYAELAARTQRVLPLTGELDDSMASLHLTFGIDSPVTEFGEVVRDGLRNALDVRIRLLRDRPPVGDSDEWIGARQDFDELMQEIGLRRMEFTEAARGELFLQPRHRYGTWWRRTPRVEPG